MHWVFPSIAFMDPRELLLVDLLQKKFLGFHKAIHMHPLNTRCFIRGELSISASFERKKTHMAIHLMTNLANRVSLLIAPPLHTFVMSKLHRWKINTKHKKGVPCLANAYNKDKQRIDGSETSSITLYLVSQRNDGSIKTIKQSKNCFCKIFPFAMLTYIPYTCIHTHTENTYYPYTHI